MQIKASQSFIKFISDLGKFFMTNYLTSFIREKILYITTNKEKCFLTGFL